MEEEDGNAHEEEYSLGLKLAVIGLCEVDPDQRLTCDEVYMWLKPYKEKINNLEKFESGFPVLKNMKKYEHLLPKMPKENTIQQPRPVVMSYQPIIKK